ncbi:helix-turn-helix transcriptional regulator [Streptomyces sp. NPDC086554]|uniref:helix-turn-helix domain-containing protein n=1 Tax=Streptomyces sp. NPDC086554 TaxID=3154864 RepID=UPI003439E4DC
MGTTGSEPPMTWRYCGNQVKLWRTRAGFTREALAVESGYDYEYVKSMEQGRRKPTLRLLQVADEMCEAHGLLLAAQDYLKPDRFPSYSKDYAEAESRASALHSYQPLFVPGQLQTEGYMRALLGANCPPLDDETIEARVAGRLQRQERLVRCPTVLFGFVIYEAALHEPVGGRDCMREQLNYLLKMGALRNISVQVLPVGQGAHTGLNGPLVLLETPDHETLAYEEGQSTGVLHSEPDKVTLLAQRHGMIRMQALNAEQSAQFIRKVAGEL